MKSDAYQFIVWGKPNDSYRHIQEAFYRTLKYQGRNVRWLTADDGGSYDKAIFISMGNIASDIPVRSDALYIIHNFLANDAKTEARLANSNVLHFGVRVASTPPPETFPDRIIDMYWATNLLPYEIKNNMRSAQLVNERSKVINWVGSVCGGNFGNEPEISAFAERAAQNGVRFKEHRDVSLEDNVRLIQESYIAPAIVGSWQKSVGYIPCRIFKNISYGQFGITNSQEINKLFHGNLICQENSAELFSSAVRTLRETPIDRLYELMDFVAAHHTYLNRLDQLLSKAEKLL